MILGLSLDENFVYVSTDISEETVSYPFAIGRNLSSKTWFIGEEAKNEDIDNVDIVIDKLFYIMETDGTARIGEDDYKASDLVKIFFSTLISKYGNVDFISVVVRRNTEVILNKILSALTQVIKDKSKIKVTTYSEAFVAFLKTKDPEYYNGAVGLYNFTEKALTYYEFLRYKGEDEAVYWKVNTKEYLSLPLDLVSGETGKKLCDNILVNFAKATLKENGYSNIILSGLGFNDASSYREFMTYVCSLANTDTMINFFSKAAVMLSKQIIDNDFDKNTIIITDARTTASIKLLATVNQVNEKITLVNPGDEWFELNNYSFDVIVDNENEIKFELLKVIEGVLRDITVAVPNSFKLRKDKTNLFEINLYFTQQNLLEITVSDKGFGEFYEARKNSTSITIEI